MPQKVSEMDDKLKSRLRYAERLRKIMTELPEVCFDYLTSIEPTTSILTRINYAGDLRTFFRYCSETGLLHCAPQEASSADFAGISSRHIEQYLEYLSIYQGASQQVLQNENLGKKRKLSALRSFFKYMLKHEYIQKDPTAIIATPKVRQKPILCLTHAEVQRLLTTIESGNSLSVRQAAYAQRMRQRDIALIMLFLGTGIRVSECVNLNIQDIDFATNSFRVQRKGGKIAILYFSNEVAEPLQAYLLQRLKMNTLQGHENALFLSTQRRRITTRAVQNLVEKFATAAVPLKHITPHKFRSTFGTELYQNTGDIYLVADVLGHEDVNTTKRHYAKQNEENRKYAANMVKLRNEDE